METQQCYVPKMRYCIPYLDHSYASELPGLPEDAVEGSLVPDSLGAFVDIEDSSHNIVNDTSIYHHENDQEDDEDRSHFNGNGYSSYNQKYKATVSNDDEEDWSDSVTRCICDFQHDDGFMISCDRCCVWQHVDCMGLNKNNIPETYLCELCLPRPIDKRRAIRLQIHKKEALDAENSKNDNRGYSNRSNQNSVGRVAETGISSDESSDGGIQLAEVSRTGRKRKLKRVDDDQFTTFNTNRKNHKQQVNNNLYRNINNNHMNRKHTPEIRPAKVPSENLYSKSYSHKRARFNSNDDGSSYNDNTDEKICLNTFTPSINNIVAQLNNNPSLNFNHHHSNFTDANFNNYLQSMSPPSSTSSSSPLNIHTMALIKKQIQNITFKPTNLSHGVGVIATETLRNGQGIAEFMGIVSTENEYINSSNFDPCYKGVMAYNLDDKHAVVIDGRSFNTSIKHIKTSCSPNAKLVHSTEGGVLRFYVVACKNISMGKEITLPMHHNYREMDVEMVCVCGKTSCSVVKFYKNKNRTKRPLKIKSPDPKKLNQNSLLSGNQSDQQNPAEILSFNKAGYMDYLATAATLSSMLTIDNNKPNNNNNFIISNNQIISADSNANTISPSTNNDINNTLNDIQNYLASEGATEIDNPLINNNSESFNDNSTNEVFNTNATANPAPITNINDFFNNPTPNNNIDYNSTNTNRNNILDSLTDSMDSFGSNDDIMPLIIAEPHHKKSHKS